MSLNVSNLIQRYVPSAVFALLFILILWPLIAGTNLLATNSQQVQLLIAFLVPIAMVLTANDFLQQKLNIRSLALIAIFISLAIALRPLGLGVAGLEPIWVAIIMAGYTLGISSGFTVGALSLFLSAIATGGVGPWLGNQMVLAALIGAGAGVVRTVRESRLILTCYSFVVTYLFGWFMNLWFWPTFSNLQSAIAFNPADSIVDRTLAWARFSFFTSTGFDLPRALLTATLVWIVSPRIKSAVQRLNAPSTHPKVSKSNASSP